MIGVRMLAFLYFTSFSLSDLNPMLPALKRDSANFQQTWQCSESWCNGSMTCSEMYKDSCPPGLLCKDSLCECPDQYPSMLRCDNVSLSILSGFCATFDESNETIVVGSCIYASFPSYTNDGPTKKTKLTTKENTICNSYNRTGALCGRCLPDHYPLAYSFNMTCIPCPNVHWNWFKYIIAAYLPLTLFYIGILFFKINTTSSHIFVVVYICQIFSLPVMAQGIYTNIAKLVNTSYLRTLEVLFFLYGIWNLDYFRPFYSDLCLGIGILPTLTLDYAIVAYPLLLMIFTYLLIVLYDRNYRVITIMSRPLFRFRRNWNIKTSLIDAFSTFFYLSNMKFLSVSLALLCPVQLYHLHGDHYNYTLGLYYAGDIEYFGSEHFPYGILAIAVMCVFVILPITVLVLYPFKFFQKFLNLFPVRWYILHTFMDSFQGCYKDGTEPDTRDYRWLASVFFINRIFMFLAYTLTNFKLCSVIIIMLLTIHTTLLAIFQPYKKSMSHLNVINIAFLYLFTISFITFVGVYIANETESSLSTAFLVVCSILSAVPQVYMFASILYWIYTHRLFGIGIMQRLRAWRNGYAFINEETDHLPDRIDNSGAYPRKNLSNFVAKSH